MKTAISIPDQVFSQADKFAHELNISRSALFTLAVSEYIQRRRHDDVTQKLNKVYSQEDSSLDSVLSQIQTLSLPKEEW